MDLITDWIFFFIYKLSGIILWPHGLYATRLLCPWNSPDKDTEGGSHSFLQGFFQAQGLNLGLLNSRHILYHLSQQGIHTHTHTHTHTPMYIVVVVQLYTYNIYICYIYVCVIYLLYIYNTYIHTHTAKVLELQLQYQSFQWIFRIGFLQDWLVWSPCSPRDSTVFSRLLDQDGGGVGCTLTPS